MNIVVLTTNVQQYLPDFFARFLESRACDTKAVYVVPPRYGKESTSDLARKYIKAFGLWNFIRVGMRTAKAKLLYTLPQIGRNGSCYSIQAACKQYGVPCEEAEDVNSEAFQTKLREMKTDLLVSVSCPQLFRKPLIELPPNGTLNVHGAKLPKYRGILPSFWMMANGEKEAGVTVFLVNENIDAGDVVEKSEFPIEPNESLDGFIRRSKLIACDTLLRAIKKIEDGHYQTDPLSMKDSSYFSFPTKDSYRQFRRRGRRLW